MSTQQPQREPQSASPAPAARPGEGNQLNDLAQQATGFLEAASSIIDKALSADSHAFLQANRQQGGQ